MRSGLPACRASPQRRVDVAVSQASCSRPGTVQNSGQAKPAQRPPRPRPPPPLPPLSDMHGGQGAFNPDDVAEAVLFCFRLSKNAVPEEVGHSRDGLSCSGALEAGWRAKEVPRSPQAGM